MAITMYQSDRNFVTPANDASLYSALGGDTSGVLRRGNMLKITTNGLTATVDTGQVVVLGRLVEVVTPTQVTLPANSQGQLCIVVDLSKTNDVNGNAGDSDYTVTVNQVYIAAVTGELTQDDINNGGFIYELPLGTFTSNSTTATFAQKNPMLNDTGWLNMDTAGSGSKVKVFAQFRVRDNVVFVRWRGVDVTNSVNRNQIGYVPRFYAPDVELVGAGTNISDDGSFRNSANTAVIEPDGLLWVNHYSGDNQIDNLNGTISYPI